MLQPLLVRLMNMFLLELRKLCAQNSLPFRLDGVTYIESTCPRASKASINGTNGMLMLSFGMWFVVVCVCVVCFFEK